VNFPGGGGGERLSRGTEKPDEFHMPQKNNF